MNKYFYFSVMFAFVTMVAGCEKETPIDLGKDLHNQLAIEDDVFDLHNVKQIWRGNMDYPVNTVNVDMGSGEGYFRIRFFIEDGESTVTPGSYRIIPEPETDEDKANIRPGDCYLYYWVFYYLPEDETFVNFRGEGFSGKITVDVTDDIYIIKMDGVQDGNHLTLRYNDKLEYWDRSQTGTSTFKYGNDPTVYDVTRLTAGEYENITYLNFEASSMFTRSESLNIDVRLAYKTPSLTEGTYTFTPSEEDRFAGVLELGNDLYIGNATSGSITVEISEDNYTFSLNDVSIARFGGGVIPLTGSYTGRIVE